MNLNWLTKRTVKHRRNNRLEDLLNELTPPLNNAEKTFLDQIDLTQSRPPTLFIVGCPRSGTTLMMQQIANSQKFSYPTNFLSRFYAAPILGTKIQKLLFDEEYQFKNELKLFSKDNLILESELGKTSGALSPHVFWYFWYKHFSFGKTSYMTKEQFQDSDLENFHKELAGLYDTYRKPFALKAMIINWNLEDFFNSNTNALFVRIKRDRYQIANSILNARFTHSGSHSGWWSFIPPEYEEIKNLPPKIQVASFVLSIEKALDRAVLNIPRSKVIEIDYETLCSDPNRQINTITNAYNDLGFDISPVIELKAQKNRGTLSKSLLKEWGSAFESAERTVTFHV